MRSALLAGVGVGIQGLDGVEKPASWLHVTSFVLGKSHSPSSSAYFRLSLA